MRANCKKTLKLLGNNCISNASLSGVCDLNIDSAKKIAGEYKPTNDVLQND